MPVINVTDLVKKPPVGELDALQEEALKLSSSLKLRAASALEPDDVFVLRACEVLMEQRLQIEILSKLVEYTALKVRALTDVLPAAKPPITQDEFIKLMETFPEDMDPGQLLYETVRKVERHHGVPGA
jgi:hypothetical protein